MLLILGPSALSVAIVLPSLPAWLVAGGSALTLPNPAWLYFAPLLRALF